MAIGLRPERRKDDGNARPDGAAAPTAAPRGEAVSRTYLDAAVARTEERRGSVRCDDGRAPSSRQVGDTPSRMAAHARKFLYVIKGGGFAAAAPEDGRRRPSSARRERAGGGRCR